MERQKIFWVVLSVSVFVVVVLVVGVFLLRQRPPAAAGVPGTVSPISDPGTQIYEYQREALSSQPGAGQTQTMHFYIGEGGETPATGQGTPPSGTTSPAGTQPSSPTLPTQSGPAAKPPVPVPQKSLPVKPPAQGKSQQRTVEYWIQTGSYRSQTKAEELATLLSGKGLTSRIFSYTSKSDTYYRVRIGPYANKKEAEKFLSIVKKLQGLESSYLSQVGSTKSIN